MSYHLIVIKASNPYTCKLVWSLFGFKFPDQVCFFWNQTDYTWVGHRVRWMSHQPKQLCTILFIKFEHFHLWPRLHAIWYYMLVWHILSSNLKFNPNVQFKLLDWELEVIVIANQLLLCFILHFLQNMLALYHLLLLLVFFSPFVRLGLLQNNLYV